MIHLYLRFVVKLLFWVYYRAIKVTGTHNVPKKGPIILACNHPNAFLDALVVGESTHRERIYFLARADVFNTPVKNWIMRQLSVLPVYRLQEGLENLDRNRDTFRECHQILDKDGVVLIFAEGLCIQELRLRPLKKGIARIAFDYIRDGRQLNVVPVSLNYLKAGTAKEEVLLDFGVPIQVADFAKDYEANPAKTITDFNKVLESRLRSGVIHIHDKSKDAAITQLLEIERSEGKELSGLVELAKRIETLSKEHPEKYEHLTAEAGRYADKLRLASLNDRAVHDKGRYSLLLSLLTPFYWVGKILNILPYATSRWATKKAVRKAEFYDSVFTGLMLFVTQFHALFIFLILVFIHPLLAVLVPCVLLLTGSVTVGLHDPLRMNKLRWRKKKMDPRLLEAIVLIRKSILEQMPR
jgi:1-acyl-sn-glycerol-3-phosphate acyltransferase